MPDPAWTFQYNTAQTPEGNGFVRALQDSPAVTVVTSGPGANRRVQVQSDAGQAYFQLSVPALNRVTGVTIEALLSSSGSGNAGLEIALLEMFVGVQVYQSSITIYVNDGQPPHSFATASNAGDTLIRITLLNNTVSVYRAGALVASLTAPDLALPFRRAQFWGEEGGTQIFKAFRAFTGGAVAPG